MSFVCTRMSSECHSYVLVCHPYVTGMYSYVIRMSLVCTRMSFVLSLVCGFTMNREKDENRADLYLCSIAFSLESGRL